MNGFQKILTKAKEDSDIVRLLFRYPGSERFTKKSGKVLFVDDSTFTIEDKFDGESTFTYEFLMEINKRGKEDEQ